MTTLTRRTALKLGTASLAGALLTSACSGTGGSGPQDLIDNPDPNINLTGMPIVNETITLSMMTMRSPNTAEDWNTVASMQAMEELSNVHVDWGLIPTEGGTERRNLALASGDYPGILNRTALTPAELARYGEAGTFVALNQLIDEHMPNLTAVLDENPDIRNGITMPDGNIYGMPTIFDPDFESLVMARNLWVRQDWLDEFGMDAPTTLDEFEEYLQAAKTDHPDTVGWTEGGMGGTMIEALWGTFGIGTRGRTVKLLDADEDGNPRLVAGAEGYRDMMDYVHRLYANGLIQNDIFTNDNAKHNNLGRSGLVAATVTMSPLEYFGDIGENYVPLAPLRADGRPEPTWNSVSSPLSNSGGFVLTDVVEHPIEAARWMDYFYSDEGARLFFMGVEGVSYEVTASGEYEYLPIINDNPEGLTQNEAQRPFITYLGGGYAGIVLEDYFKGVESSEQCRQGTEVVKPYAIDEVWPNFTYSSEEARELSSLNGDLTKLIGESRAKFMNGELPISDWDTYTSQLEQAGQSRFMEIQQAAYDRYQG